MSRFIAQLLVVTLLTLNIAWAVDECALNDPGTPDGSSVQTDAQPPLDSANTGFDCDDWCHAWAHSVALPSTTIIDGCTCGFIPGVTRILSYSSPGVSPPFHPPIT